VDDDRLRGPLRARRLPVPGVRHGPELRRRERHLRPPSRGSVAVGDRPAVPVVRLPRRRHGRHRQLERDPLREPARDGLLVGAVDDQLLLRAVQAEGGPASQLLWSHQEHPARRQLHVERRRGRPAGRRRLLRVLPARCACAPPPWRPAAAHSRSRPRAGASFTAARSPDAWRCPAVRDHGVPGVHLCKHRLGRRGPAGARPAHQPVDALRQPVQLVRMRRRAVVAARGPRC